MSTKKRYMIANLVYGQPYTDLFLEHHVKTLMDPTNIPALREKYDVEYVVFTDEETFMGITRHPNFMALGSVCELNIIKMSWPADADRFASRYGLLVDMFHRALDRALNPERPAWAMSVWVADLVFAKDCLPRIMGRLEDGHDAVFNVPIRSAVDGIFNVFRQNQEAPTDMELFDLAYKNLHHLWVACHWDSPMFTRMPYSLLWNSYSGLCAHHFGVTPIVFKPTEEMRKVRGVIDADVPAFAKNPFWATDWTDAPVAGVEPLSNGHYPPFQQKKASVDYVKQWATAKLGPNGERAILPEQEQWLHKPMFYPNKRTFAHDPLAKRAGETAEQIQRVIREELRG